ncbi:MAG: hypothetical protein Q7S22_05295 [Candidatus Micrarchaeota archaeon]|nr:hypothetical protein [Candidatus Micrarchaeota archaeon]
MKHVKLQPHNRRSRKSAKITEPLAESIVRKNNRDIKEIGKLFSKIINSSGIASLNEIEKLSNAASALMTMASKGIDISDAIPGIVYGATNDKCTLYHLLQWRTTGRLYPLSHSLIFSVDNPKSRETATFAVLELLSKCGLGIKTELIKGLLTKSERQKTDGVSMAKFIPIFTTAISNEPVSVDATKILINMIIAGIDRDEVIEAVKKLKSNRIDEGFGRDTWYKCMVIIATTIDLDIITEIRILTRELSSESEQIRWLCDEKLKRALRREGIRDKLLEEISCIVADENETTEVRRMAVDLIFRERSDGRYIFSAIPALIRALGDERLEKIGGSDVLHILEGCIRSKDDLPIRSYSEGQSCVNSGAELTHERETVVESIMEFMDSKEFYVCITENNTRYERIINAFIELMNDLKRVIKEEEQTEIIDRYRD